MATRTITIPGATDQTDNPSHAGVHAGHAGGWLGYVDRTSNQTTITSEADLSSLTVTVDVPADRRLKVTGSARVRGVDGSADAFLRIKEDGTQIQRAIAHPGGASAENDDTVMIQAVVTPSAGSTTYKLTLEKVAGGASSLSVIAASDAPAFLLVEDIGPAS
jgi:hypothetical protein